MFFGRLVALLTINYLKKIKKFEILTDENSCPFTMKAHIIY